MSGYNGFNSGMTLDSIGLEGEDIPSMPGTGAIRFNTSTRSLELSNDGAAWLQIGAGPAASISAGTNINITTSGGNSVISTVASPNFTDVTLGTTSLASIASTVTTDLNQPVTTTSNPTFASLSATDIYLPTVGHTHITDQQIQWPSGRLTFMQNITSSVEIGANAIYLKNVHSNGAGNLNLSDNMTCDPGILIDGRDISVDGTTLDSTVTTVGTLNGYLNQAVKTTSSPSFVAVNTTAINSTSGMTNQQKYSNWVDTDPYSSTGGERLSLYADAGSAVTSGSRMGILTIGGATTATHNYGDGIYLEGKATQAWSGTAQGSQLNVWTCPNNTTAPIKCATFDQDQSLNVIQGISWKNSLATLTKTGADPMIQSTNAMHINVNATDVAVFGTGGVTTLNALDTLNVTTGLVANNLVIGTTGTGVGGGVRYNAGTLQYYNGSAWTSTGTVVTAGTNLTFSGTALGTVANPTFSGLTTSNNGMAANINNSGGSSLILNNTADNQYIQTIWAFAPNLTSGHQCEFYHGVSASTNNCAIIDFNYAGSGSAANTVGLGFYGANNRLTVDTGGNCKATGSIWATGNLIGSKLLGNTNVIKVQPTSGSTSQDFYISSDQSDTTALQISPLNSGTTYIKSNASGKNIQFQGWVSGVPTNFVNISDTTVFVDRLQCGSSRNAVAGSINFNTSGNILEYYNGTAWQTLTTGSLPSNIYQTFGTKIDVTNNSGFLTPTVYTSFSLGGLTYSLSINPSNASADLTIPGNFSSDPVVQITIATCDCAIVPLTFRVTKSGTNVLQIIPGISGTDKLWTDILPTTGQYITLYVFATGL